jgi:hypothetical protein
MLCVLFSGLARGRWVTSGDLVMEGQRMACGLIRGLSPALRDLDSRGCTNDRFLTVIILVTSGLSRTRL